jgi:hypothetical protein
MILFFAGMATALLGSCIVLAWIAWTARIANDPSPTSGRIIPFTKRPRRGVAL